MMCIYEMGEHLKNWHASYESDSMILVFWMLFNLFSMAHVMIYFTRSCWYAWIIWEQSPKKGALLSAVLLWVDINVCLVGLAVAALYWCELCSFGLLYLTAGGGLWWWLLRPHHMNVVIWKKRLVHHLSCWSGVSVLHQLSSHGYHKQWVNGILELPRLCQRTAYDDWLRQPGHRVMRLNHVCVQRNVT